MSRKTIPIPGIYDVDISRIRPIIDHYLFQRLRFKKQLGTGFFTFPSATHTRFEHALGTFSLTQERAARWVQDGTISSAEAWNLSLFGLLHDIGHGPYSHLIEELCPLDHNAHGQEILAELRDPIEKCEASFSEIERLCKRQNPLKVAVSHHPLGTDKLDYLTRDARHTNEAVSLTMGAILNYSYFSNGELVIDSKIISEVAEAQRFYVYMYNRVYGRKSCLITTRFLQKMIRLLLQEQEISSQKLLECVDSELDALLFNSSTALVKHLFRRLLERRFPRVAIALHSFGSPAGERLPEKPMYMYRLHQTAIDLLTGLSSLERMEQLEAGIAEIAGLPGYAVTITLATSSQRFVPPDITVSEASQPIGTLRQLRPHHYASLREIAESRAVLRVCVFDEYRAKLASPPLAQKIIEYILAQAQL